MKCLLDIIFLVDSRSIVKLIFKNKSIFTLIYRVVAIYFSFFPSYFFYYIQQQSVCVLSWNFDIFS